jgi:hypothetical protein
MRVELRDTGQIKPYEGNPRVNDPAVDAVAASLREFAFRQPIVVDPTKTNRPSPPRPRWTAAAGPCSSTTSNKPTPSCAPDGAAP